MTPLEFLPLHKVEQESHAAVFDVTIVIGERSAVAIELGKLRPPAKTGSVESVQEYSVRRQIGFEEQAGRKIDTPRA